MPSGVSSRGNNTGKLFITLLGRYLAKVSVVMLRSVSMMEICSVTFFSWRTLPSQR